MAWRSAGWRWRRSEVGEETLPGCTPPHLPGQVEANPEPATGVPLFLDKHELLHWYPFGVNWTTSGLFLCTLSYREYLVLGLVADPTGVAKVMVPVGGVTGDSQITITPTAPNPNQNTSSDHRKVQVFGMVQKLRVLRIRPQASGVCAQF